MTSYYYYKDKMTKQKRNKKRSSDSEVDEEEEQESDDDDSKPEAPAERHFDEQQTRADILKVMHESLTPPGEQFIVLSLAQTRITSASTRDAR